MQISPKLSVCVLTGILLAATHSAEAQSWSRQVVDTEPAKFVGTYSSLAIDALGNPHVSYYAPHDLQLRYATRGFGGWQIEVVDGGVAPVEAFHTSLALDASGKVHISYYDDLTLELRYATNATASGDFEIDVVDAGAGDTSIAVDGSGLVHIAYVHTTEGLKHARGSLGSWTLETVDSVGNWASIALDTNGDVHLSYSYFFGQLQYRKFSGGAWSAPEVVDNTAARDNAIAVGAAGTVHIAYAGANHDLRYATNASGSFQLETVDAEGRNGSPDIALDSRGSPRVSYGQIPIDDVFYAQKNGAGVWERETVAANGNGQFGAFTSIALDQSNRAHVTYFTDSGWLELASQVRFDNTDTIDAVGRVGAFSSLATDSTGGAHISYYDQTNGDLKYATNASGTWQANPVDTGGDVGLFTSLALDSSEEVHVSYYDLTNGALKYVRTVAGVWQTPEVLADAGNEGLFTSIGVDDDDFVHISYYDDSDDDLKYATNQPEAVRPCSGARENGWCKETVDGGGSVGLYTSLAIDSNGKVHISYEDNTRDSLKYANNTLGPWVNFTVDGPFGPFDPPLPERHFRTSIAVDSRNAVHITYGQPARPRGDHGFLWYTSNVSGSWTKKFIDGGYAMGRLDHSIGIDSRDRVHVMYSALFSSSRRFFQNVVYATNVTGTWRWEAVDGGGWLRHPDVALDSMGRVHVSYHDQGVGSLEYGRRDAFVLPKPDVRVNGSDGPVTIGTGDVATVSMSLAAGSALGDPADWWILALIPGGTWAHFDASDGQWHSGFGVTYQGPLVELSTFDLLSANLGPGRWMFFLAFDFQPNGAMDSGSLFLDYVELNVTP